MQEHEYLTAIEIEKGIIKLIGVNGDIEFYRQRGIQKLPKDIVNRLIANGELYKNWEKCKELPRNYSISYEDSEIQGRALATFPAYLKYKRNK